MSLSEDDPMQLYQKFTESFNKIAKQDEPNGQYPHYENQLNNFNEFGPVTQYDGSSGQKPGYQYQAASSASSALPLPSPALAQPQMATLEPRQGQDWYNPTGFPLASETQNHSFNNYGAIPAYDYQQPYIGQDPMFGMVNGFPARPPGAAALEPGQAEQLHSGVPAGMQPHPGINGGQPMLDEALNMLRAHDGNTNNQNLPLGLDSPANMAGIMASKRKGSESIPLDQQPSSSTSSGRGRPRTKRPKKADEAEAAEDDSMVKTF